MALKFKCDNCQKVMIVRAHKVGEYAACGSCRLYSIVPESAENIEEDLAAALEAELKNQNNVSEGEKPETDGTSDYSVTSRNKYPALRIIASLYKILAYVTVVLTIISCVMILMVTLSEADSYGFLRIILCAFLGAIIIITFLALSEGIMIYLDMANDLSKIKEDMGNDLSEIKRRLINSSD